MISALSDQVPVPVGESACLEIYRGRVSANLLSFNEYLLKDNCLFNTFITNTYITIDNR